MINELEQLVGVFNILGDPRQYSQPEISGGCLQQQCQQILTEFFQQKRHNRKV